MANARNLSLPTSSVLPLTVRIYGLPRPSSWVLASAESEAARMLSEAHVDIKWLDCRSPGLRPSVCSSPVSSVELSVRLLSQGLPEVPRTVLGVAISAADGGGALIFYDRVLALRADSRPLPAILGRVLAHELIHLLLPLEGHASLGLMRGHWNVEDLSVTSAKCLGLSARSVDLIRREVTRRALSARTNISGEYRPTSKPTPEASARRLPNLVKSTDPTT